MQNAWAWRNEAAEAFAAPATAAVRYTPQDLLAMLWRERFLMLGVFALVAGLGLAVALSLKTTYQAHSSLLIRLSPEYVYNPRVGDAARGLAPESDSVVQSESEILASAGLKARVIADIGLARLYPKLGQAYAAASPAKRQDIQGAAIKALGAGLKIATAPGDSVVRLSFNDPDPERAALVLNTLVDEYLRYRTTVLMSRDANVIGQQASDFQTRLNAADAAYAKFLSDNNISDFDAEKAALSQIYSQLLTDSYNVTAQLSEAEGRLGATAAEFGRTPAEIGLSRDLDHTAADKLITLRLQRQDLLSRYTAQAQPVQDADRQISELEAQQQFLDAMRLHGLKPKGLPILDGKLHYVPVEGNKGTETSGAYKGFYEGRRPAGAIYNYKQGGWVGSWKADGESKTLTAEEMVALSRQAAELAAARNLERIERENAGAAEAKAILAGAGPADGSHPYLQAKGVPAVGLFVAAPGQTVLVRGEDGVERRYAIGGRLIVPLRSVETGELRNVQTIAADGTKLYLAGAQKAGTALILGDVRAGESVAIAEGYATAATVHVATGMAVAMALDTSNLGPVARELRRQDGGRALYMAADNDHHLPLREKPLPNAGKDKAKKVAADVGAVVLLPDPVPLRVEAGKGTDWNDAAAHRGIDAVAAAIRSGMREAATPRLEETQRAASRPSAGM